MLAEKMSTTTRSPAIAIDNKPSRIQSPSDLKFLRSYGADAFLIGSSIMQSDSIEQKVMEFVNA